MNVFVPEAGGDSGVGCVRALWGAGYPGKIVVMDMDRIGLMPSFVENRIVSGAKDALASGDLLGVLGEFGNEGVLLPTAEHMPEVVFDLVDRGLWPKTVDLFLPTRDGWEVSRDKLRLSDMFIDAEGVGRTWSRERRFMKPRHGVGSRGCRVVLTQEEADAWVDSSEEYVFMRELDGPEIVVDVVLSTLGGELDEPAVLCREVFRQRGGADFVMKFCTMPKEEKIAIAIAEALDAPVANVQMRYLEGEPRVIDVGTRMSGAINCASLAGVNAVMFLLTGKREFWKPREALVRRSFIPHEV